MAQNVDFERISDNVVLAHSHKIEEQLALILRDPLFKNSKRYPQLLEYVVRETINGNADQLKERTIGFSVFGREASYDTNADAIVRVTAAEVRRRLIQYYASHTQELHIEIPAGAYVPEFYIQRAEERESASPLVQHLQPISSSVIEDISVRGKPGVDSPSLKVPSSNLFRVRSIAILSGILILMTVIVGGLFWQSQKSHEDGDAVLARFWNIQPEDGVAQLCVGQVDQYEPFKTLEANGKISLGPQGTGLVTFSDIVPLAEVARVLGRIGARTQLRPSQAASFTDLQQGPLVLIGAFDNVWTIKLSRPLRYVFVQNNQFPYPSIVDTASPKVAYAVDTTKPYSRLTEDFAIVARFVSPTTEKSVFLLGGLGGNGTLAAATFATTPRYLQELDGLFGTSQWQHRNFELLLKTQVIDGREGPPKIIGSYSWK